ncbi:polysaccharide deacetylase family protein [Salinigranum salinum]|uniref:polysaccharide deacetylase family protein n=1 Tax=Salinigranum salinum TaxID=1364937 RepID=UPI0012608D14|nr:polysaccharide deacetylase family protein [Salinigranum salinum]
MSEMHAVMYHYVRPSPDRPPHGYYHLALDDFRRQLDHFGKRYGFVDREAFVGWLYGERGVPDGVVLTFDDALVDHYEWVLPELRRRDLWGLFFVPTGPFVTDRPLPVHRIHSLVGAVPADSLRHELEAVLDANPAALDGADSVADAYGEQSSGAAVSEFKRLLNFVVSPGDVQAVLDRLERRLDGYESPSVDDYYLSTEEVEEMVDAGMLFGAHSVTHPVLSRLSPEGQRDEITSSVAWVAEQVGPQPVSTFAYPYGGRETFTDATIDALVDAGCDAAFTTESGVIAGKTASEPFALPRRDCNEFDHGGATFDLP